MNSKVKIHEKSETIGGTELARNLTMLPARFEKIVVIFDTATKAKGGMIRIRKSTFLPESFYRFHADACCPDSDTLSFFLGWFGAKK